MYLFRGATVYLEGKGLCRCDLPFDTRILPCDTDLSCATPIDLPEQAIVLPGFVDEHIHGAGGADAMDGGDAPAVLAQTIAKEGTTSFLATTMTQTEEAVTHALTSIRTYIEQAPTTGARLLGAHLEGPFLSTAWKGAMQESLIVPADIALFDRLQQASGGNVRMVTLAPETEGALALIAHLKAQGVVASIGHTCATQKQVMDAVLAGAINVTHTYNAQSPLHHREIGAVGTALLEDRLQTELIADTIHVSVGAMQILFRCKPSNKVTLITDAIRAKGMSDGDWELGGQPVFVKNGEARLANGTLAGSTLCMNEAIRNVTEQVGIPFLQAVDCATLHPATTLGLGEELGSIRTGKRADFAVLAPDYSVLLTIRDGQIIYQA